MKQLKDIELVELSKAGDMKAFQTIIERYESQVATMIRNMLGNVAEVEDVGQEVFIRLYRSLEQFRGDASLGTYVTRIAINLSINALQKRKKKRWFSISQREQEKDYDLPDESYNSEQYDTKELVEKAMSYLKEEHRLIITLRLIQGYSVKETAQILEIAEGTVLSRQSRASAQLKKILKEKMSYKYGE